MLVTTARVFLEWSHFELKAKVPTLSSKTHSWLWQTDACTEPGPGSARSFFQLKGSFTSSVLSVWDCCKVNNIASNCHYLLFQDE